MNWKEKLRKECEHLNEVSGFYSFSVMQIQQDKEYFEDTWRDVLAGCTALLERLCQ